MAKNKTRVATIGSPLSSCVSISRQFLRSIRIDSDLDSEDALSGYICQGTARSVLEGMARHILETRQRAFTWTGPYGGGKSSLALLLCSLVGANPKLRSKSRAILGLERDHPVHKAFSSEGEGWLVLPVVGKRDSVVGALSRAYKAARGNTRGAPLKADTLIEQLLTESTERQGVLVMIDELGKFLEASAQGQGDDINFFQDLAERASRSDGRLIVVGILHQAFDAYATRLGRQARDDWSKVQGRFTDIPLVSATDEVLQLVARAIDVAPGVERRNKSYVQTVVDAIRDRRPGTPASIQASLENCWPLHPSTAALLGPISRRKFGQNERSTFGFLASREPFGFAEFLEGARLGDGSVYEPSRFWDYLRANLEPSILASPDGHRWSAAVDAVERAEAKGESLHVRLTKTVGLIELFTGGSGLAAEERVLLASIISGGQEAAAVHRALQELVQWKVLIERRHLNAFGIFAGSDFDIESAIALAKNEMSSNVVEHITALADLQPVLAKRLYARTGTMRWFARKIVLASNLEQSLSQFKLESGAAGSFILCLPDNLESDANGRVQWAASMHQNAHVLLGAPKNAARIFELASELSAAERVLKTRSELEGDSVARREIAARISSLRGSLEEEFIDGLQRCIWHWPGGARPTLEGSLPWVASEVAAALFPDTPHIHNELINRQSPSPNAVKARRDLMYRMIRFGDRPLLGYEGYPADAGLYHTVLRKLGLHKVIAAGEARFSAPLPNSDATQQSLLPMWSAAEKIAFASERISVLALHDLWQGGSFGLRSGVTPILSLAFYLAHRSSLALYIDGVFTPELSELVVDEWLRAPRTITFQYVEASQDSASLLSGIRSIVAKRSNTLVGESSLDIARALVARVLALPMWARRTMTVSKQAQDVRAMLLKASDPHKVLFSDLPTILGVKDADDLASKLDAALAELELAYPSMLDRVRRQVLVGLDQLDGDGERIRERAQAVKGMTGDLKLESLIVHLLKYDGSQQVIEGLISSAIGRSSINWVDRDIDAALFQLASFAVEFRKAEVMAPLVKGAASSRRLIGLVFGMGQGKPITQSVDVSDAELPRVKALVSQLLDSMKSEKKELVLAALAEAGVALVAQNKTEVMNG